MDFSKQSLAATEFQLGVPTKKGGSMSRLTENLIQVLIGIAILYLVIGGTAIAYKDLISEKAVLKQQLRDYDSALRQAQNTNKVLSALPVKK